MTAIKISKLKFSTRMKEVRPRKKPTLKKVTKTRVLTQKQLNSLRRTGVPRGKVLNPYGKFGDSFRSRWRLGYRESWREDSMKRKRIKLKEKAAIALEAHELQKLARENATAAMNTLIAISKNPRAPEATRIAASQVILDRGYGKASQTSITASVGGKTRELDGDELEKRVKNALKRVEDLTNRTRKAPKVEEAPVDVRKLN